MLLQAMADQFGVPVTEYADIAFEAELAPKFCYGCAVFLDTDRVNFQKEGFSKEELLAGLAQVLPKNVWQYVVQIPRLASLGTQVRAAGRHAVQPRGRQGAGRLHQGARARTPRCSSTRTPARPARSAPRWRPSASCKRSGKSTLHRPRRGDQPRVHDEERRGDRLPLLPERVQAHVHRHEDARTARTSRYISGFSCEKGTVESKEAMLDLVAERKKIAQQFPNMVDYEAKLAFMALLRRRRRCPKTARRSRTSSVKKGIFGAAPQWRSTRPFQRSSQGGAGERRTHVRIGIPRVLNIYSTAPFFRDLLRGARHRPSRTSSSRDETTEEMWVEGGKYGSIDPCFP